MILLTPLMSIFETKRRIKNTWILLLICKISFYRQSFSYNNKLRTQYTSSKNLICFVQEEVRQIVLSNNI